MTAQLKVHSSIDQIAAHEWDALTPDYPFLQHAFLDVLEKHGAIAATTGWQPNYIVLREGDRLRAALPCFVKSHSHGEFVFDWAWADAAEQIGLEYYPKLLCSAPFSPVQGPRLLTEHKPDKVTLVQALIEIVKHYGLSSAHINFVESDDGAVLQQCDLLERRGWQYHWHNHDYHDFEHFLAALTHKKRKNIRQERTRLQRQGWTFERIDGRHAEAQHWDYMHRLYCNTFSRKGNWILFSRDLFSEWGQRLGAAVILILAKHQSRYRAGALLFRSSDTLYGRYWGCETPVPGLHFETCYYQGIDLAIAEGLNRFDPGAQGEHKIPRGFLPVETRSFHYIADPQLRALVRSSLRHEKYHHAAQLTAFENHNPYRAKPS